MTSTLDTSVIVTGKRKRAAVSYAEDEFDALVALDGPQDVLDEGESLEDFDDFSFGSRKRSSKKRASKRLRWTAPSKPKAENPFRFLDLPPELRDIIYEMALMDAHGISIVSKTKAQRRTVCRGRVYASDQYTNGYGRWGRRRHHLNNDSQETAPKETSLIPKLLGGCKQIYNEGVDFLYGQEFHFEDTTSLHHFLATIGLRNHPRLLSIAIKEWGSGRGISKAMNFSAFSLLVAATNLRSVSLDCSIGWYSEPEKVAATVYRNAHYFLEAYGCAKGNKGAAADIFELGSTTLSSRRYNYGGNAPSDPEESEALMARFKFKLCSLLGA